MRGEGSLSTGAHTSVVKLQLPADDVVRARRAVALQTLRGLPRDDAATILEMLGLLDHATDLRED